MRAYRNNHVWIVSSMVGTVQREVKFINWQTETHSAWSECKADALVFIPSSRIWWFLSWRLRWCPETAAASFHFRFLFPFPALSWPLSASQYATWHPREVTRGLPEPDPPCATCPRAFKLCRAVSSGVMGFPVCGFAISAHRQSNKGEGFILEHRLSLKGMEYTAKGR